MTPPDTRPHTFTFHVALAPIDVYNAMGNLPLVTSTFVPATGDPSLLRAAFDVPACDEDGSWGETITVDAHPDGSAKGANGMGGGCILTVAIAPKDGVVGLAGADGADGGRRSRDERLASEFRSAIGKIIRRMREERPWTS